MLRPQIRAPDKGTVDNFLFLDEDICCDPLDGSNEGSQHIFI